MLPTDIELLTAPRSPALHGDLLLTGLSRPDLEANRAHGVVRRVGLAGGDRPWTYGPRDSAPAISPDGSRVAFLRVTGERGAQVHVMPADGGEAKRITDVPLGVEGYSWGPDSRRIAFTARVPEPGRYGTPDAGGRTPDAGAEAPRRITRFDYRIDHVGFLLDRPQRLFVVDSEIEEPTELTPLTDDRVDVHDPEWTPDGEFVLVAAPRDWGRVETLNSDLYAVPVAGGEPVLAVRTEGDAAAPLVTADGTVYFHGLEFTGVDMVRNRGLWTAPLRTDGEPATARRMTDAETVDTDSGAGRPAVLGDEVLVVVRTHGAAELRAVPLDAHLAKLADLRCLLGEKAAVQAFTVDGERVAAVVASPSDAGEVVLLENGESRTLTEFSAPLRGKVRTAVELTATASDGHEVHGWVVLPEGDGPHPVLLVIHGGPFSPYEWSLFDEAQVYASAGYAVVMANPRGSAGYGEAHGRAIVGALCTVDVTDLLSFLDAALERPDLDASRVGVMGGSYGGLMTTWLSAHHGERFRAAWSERAVNAWDSFAGSSDIGWEFAECYVGTDPEVQRERSPLTYAAKIGIPFAVVHSEEDWRCPLEQAQRLFVALRGNGVETEFLLFPGEGHELSRSGRPRHRVQRFDAVLEWWGRHLA
ncbi:S9 family peptidase [Saccharothrix sp. AJ9571]|nr:S9 family peptidase [Saccharothrix sp. AJ9571]